MPAVLGATDALGEGVVVLPRHPDLYPLRVRSAAELGIHPEVPEWAPQFQACPLTALPPAPEGTFRHAAPFGEL